MALRAAPFLQPSERTTSVTSPPSAETGCNCFSCPGGKPGSLRLLESLQQLGALQRLVPSQGAPHGALQTAAKEGPASAAAARLKGGGGAPLPAAALESPHHHPRPVVLGPRRKGCSLRSPLHGRSSGVLHHSADSAYGASAGGVGPPPAVSTRDSNSSTSCTSKMNVEIAEVALLLEGGEDLATSQQEALAKYLRLMSLSFPASLHSDLLYAGERLREAGTIGAAGGHGGAPLGGSEAGRRAAVVDIIMSYAADLQRCFAGAAGDVARVSIQLAVSILDRSRLVERVSKDPDSLRCCAAFCLVMALQHEAPNSLALEVKLKKLLLLEKLVPETFGVPFGELHREVLDRLDCRVSAPLPIDFASYLLYDAAAVGGPPGAPGGPPASTTELVCYLLDCFSLTPEAAITPASLAAAAAVELARRIACAEKGASQGEGGPQGAPLVQQIAGYSKQQLRETLKTIHSFLTTKASKYPGLKRLHEKGWAAVDWQLPQR